MMIHMNSSMKVYFENFNVKPQCWQIDQNLKNILENGFIVIGECVFFKNMASENFITKIAKPEEITSEFLDFSGYENSVNKFHIGDYVSENIFEQSFQFLNEFELFWYKNFKDIDFVAVLTFQDDEIGKFSTFSFHKFRKLEMVYDLEKVEKYFQPVMIRTPTIHDL